MKTYDILTNKTGAMVAVPKGFNWCALFFGGLWAFACKEFQLGLLMILWLVLLQTVTGTLADLYLSWVTLVLAFVPFFSSFAVYGVFGNKWRLAYLSKKGFGHVCTVAADDPESALARYATESERQ